MYLLQGNLRELRNYSCWTRITITGSYCTSQMVKTIKIYNPAGQSAGADTVPAAPAPGSNDRMRKIPDSGIQYCTVHVLYDGSIVMMGVE